MFVSLVLNHSVAADADVGPGHLHSVQSDPATQTGASPVKGGKEKHTEKSQEKGENRSSVRWEHL